MQDLEWQPETCHKILSLGPGEDLVGRHPPFGLVESEAHGLRVVGPVLCGKHPLVCLGGDDGHHPEVAIALSLLQVLLDMVDLAVIPAVRSASSNAEPDVVVAGEGGDVTTELVTDPVKDGRRRDRVAQMTGEEDHRLIPDLEIGHLGVEIQPVDTVDLQRHMPVQHVIDVRHARHTTSVDAGGRALPARQLTQALGRDRRGPGGGLALLPLSGSRHKFSREWSSDQAEGSLR
jgi:hypothetical protein